MPRSFIVQHFSIFVEIILLIFLPASVVFILTTPADLALPATRFYKFLTILAAFGSSIVALNLVYDAERNKEQEDKQLALSTTNAVNRLWTDENKYIQKVFDDAPDFCKEIQPDVFNNFEAPVDLKLTDKTIATETAIAIRLFQSWDDYRNLWTSGIEDQTDVFSWITSFLSWGHSQRLKMYWAKLRSNYPIETIIFANYIFQNADEMRLLRANQGGKASTLDYYRTANQMIPTIVKIFGSKYPNLDSPIKSWPEIEKYINNEARFPSDIKDSQNQTKQLVGAWLQK